VRIERGTMEVSMLSAMGIPAEAMLSIRAGVTRRQAPATAGKSLKFPNLEGGQLLKVDIMQKIGSSYVVLKPGSHAEAKYKLDFGDSMACELEVKQGTRDAPKKMEEEEPEQKVTAMSVKDAKEYLDASGLLQFMQSVLQVVVKERPKDPFRFMAKHFSSGYDVFEEGKAAPDMPAAPTEELKVDEKEEAAPPQDLVTEAPAEAKVAEEATADPEIVEVLEPKQEAAAPPPAAEAPAAAAAEQKEEEKAEAEAPPPPLPPTEEAASPPPPTVPPLKLPQPIAPVGAAYQPAPCLCGGGGDQSHTSCSKESVDVDLDPSLAEVQVQPEPKACLPTVEEAAEPPAGLPEPAKVEAPAPATPSTAAPSPWQASGYPLPAAVMPCHTMYGSFFGSMPAAMGLMFI